MSSDSNEVVVYTSQDQFVAEPIFAEFTRRTGVRALPVFDTESAKTVGLANRLRAEAAHPQCDVFWSNEELLMRRLVAAGAVDKESFAETGFRRRVLLVNTNLIPISGAPRTIAELTQPKWRGRVAMAYPLFGTTAFHFAWLRESWGDADWEARCRDLVKNGVRVVDGNSVVATLVGRGEVAVGLTDSDDAAAVQREGRPVAALNPGDEWPAVRATVGLITGRPHAKTAAMLHEFLKSREVTAMLVRQGGMSAETNVGEIPPWAGILARWDDTTTRLREYFVR